MHDLETIKRLNKQAIEEGEESVLHNRISEVHRPTEDSVNPVPTMPCMVGPDERFDVSMPTGNVFTRVNVDFIRRSFPEISPNIFPHFGLRALALHLEDGTAISIRRSGEGDTDIDQSDRLHLAASLQAKAYKLSKYNAPAFRLKLANAPAAFLVSLSNFFEDIETT